ncbi:MAG: FAD/NAD(P)-binding oxidoreductase [Pseudomonadota bacterium]
MTSKHCVVVGGSHAGSQVALNLAKAGWDGAITLIGDEPYMPYHRPPLSKDFLAGAKTLDQLHLRPSAQYEKANVAVRLGETVTAIDRSEQTVTVGDGATLHYDRLVLATGARVRRLPTDGAQLPGVFYLRNAADSLAIQAAAETATAAAVIGGGYIGLEAAATLRKRGLPVTVIEAADRVLQRVTSPEMSAFFERVHTEEGVDVRTSTGVTRILGTSHVTGVELADGAHIDADLVIVGIGVVPNVELAEAAGIDCDDGIVVDELARTSDPNIWACGDCAAGHNRYLSRRLRLESVQNANDQGLVVARSIAGGTEPYDAVPWFWSTQYDVKLQIAGLTTDYTSTVARGDMRSGRSFALCYLDGTRLIAVDAVNAPRDFIMARQLLTDRAEVDVDRLQHADTPLAECRV